MLAGAAGGVDRQFYCLLDYLDHGLLGWDNSANAAPPQMVYRTMILFRPTGNEELLLVEASGWRAWPPRLPDQPIFYPVTTFEYAEKIARDWNSTRPAPDNVGYVTRFEIDEPTASRYPVQEAGGTTNRELWVPAEELGRFNSGIVGLIELVAKCRNGERVAE